MCEAEIESNSNNFRAMLTQKVFSWFRNKTEHWQVSKSLARLDMFDKMPSFQKHITLEFSHHIISSKFSEQTRKSYLRPCQKFPQSTSKLSNRNWSSCNICWVRGGSFFETWRNHFPSFTRPNDRPTDQPIHFDAIHHYGPALSLSQQRISSNSIQQRTSFAPPSPPILDPKARAKFIISLFTIRCTRTTYKLGARSVVRLLNMAPGSLRARCGDDGDQKRPEQSWHNERRL